MSIKIAKCEIDKENQISAFFEVIILGKDDHFFNQILTIIESYANHFDNLTIGYCHYDTEHDLTVVLQKGNEKGTIFILIDVLSDLLSEKSDYFEEVTLLSNNILLNLAQSTIINCLGFQRHLVSLESISRIESQSNYASSLGLLTNDLNNQEPEMRDIKHLIVDFNICKQSYFPSIIDALPTGLEPETLIQLIRFSTNSPILKSVFFNTENIDLNAEHSTVKTMIAECTWYLLEGISIGAPEIDAQCETTFCTLKDHDIDLEFIYSSKSNKYWVKLFDASNKNPFIACSAIEYEEGCQGQISNRLFRKMFNAE